MADVLLVTGSRALGDTPATRGTQHTMRLAREHGIAVEVLTCPIEQGPR